MKCFNNEQLLRNLIKELDWNIVQNRLIGSHVEMVNLRDIISLIGNGYDPQESLENDRATNQKYSEDMFLDPQGILPSFLL